MSSFRRARSGRTVVADSRHAHYLAQMWTCNMGEMYVAWPVLRYSALPGQPLRVTGPTWWLVRRATLREVLVERNRLAGEVDARLRRGEKP